MSKRHINASKRTYNSEQEYNAMHYAQIERLYETECIHGKPNAHNCTKCFKRAMRHPNLKKAERKRNRKRQEYKRKRNAYAL